MTPQLPRWLDGVSETAVRRLRLQVQDITGRLLLRVLPKVRLPKVLVRLPETLFGSVVAGEVTETVRRALLSVRPMFITAAETEKALAALPKSHLRRLTVIAVRCPKGVLLLQVVRIPDQLPGARYDRYLVMPTSAATYVTEYPDEQRDTGAWFLNHHDETFSLRCRCHSRPVTLTPQQLRGESPPPRTMVVRSLERYIALTITASWERPSVYSFVNSSTRPAASLQVFAFDDDYSFGILSSGLHRLWFEARCSRLKADLRYTSTTVFDSFPWPQAPTTAQVNAIEKIVDKLLQVRAENLAAGMSLAHQYDTLRQPSKSRLRTLHADLDAAVLSAYGLSPEDDLLAQLLALNLNVAAEPEHARGPGRT